MLADQKRSVIVTQQERHKPAKPGGGTGGHGPAPVPAFRGPRYDGSFPPDAKPSDVQDPGSKTTTGDPKRHKTDNRS